MSSNQNLTTEDYVVFGVCLGISAAIGVFYAIKERRRQDDENYQLGGRFVEFKANFEFNQI